MATIKDLVRLTGILERRLTFPKDTLSISQNYSRYKLEFKDSADWTRLLTKKELEIAIKGMIDGIDYYKDRVKLRKK